MDQPENLFPVSLLELGAFQLVSTRVEGVFMRGLISGASPYDSSQLIFPLLRRRIVFLKLPSYCSPFLAILRRWDYVIFLEAIDQCTFH